MGIGTVAKASRPADSPVHIKKYANRRLYNTQSSSYVTLEQLAAMVKEGVDFVVVDAKSEEDLTRSVLTQIIVEQENKGENLLPIGFLRQLIGCYGDGLQSMLPNYLEATMEAFARNQEQMREEMSEALSGVFPVRQLEDMARQNIAMFEQAMRMFQPGTGQSQAVPQASAPEPPVPEAADETELAALRRQLAEMQRQIDRLGEKDGAG
jgi:polyhydroxyalkanoate synthesis repressor PhaR